MPTNDIKAVKAASYQDFFNDEFIDPLLYQQSIGKWLIEDVEQILKDKKTVMYESYMEIKNEHPV